MSDASAVRTKSIFLLALFVTVLAASLARHEIIIDVGGTQKNFVEWTALGLICLVLGSWVLWARGYTHFMGGKFFFLISAATLLETLFFLGIADYVNNPEVAAIPVIVLHWVGVVSFFFTPMVAALALVYALNPSSRNGIETMFLEHL